MRGNIPFLSHPRGLTVICNVFRNSDVKADYEILFRINAKKSAQEKKEVWVFGSRERVFLLTNNKKLFVVRVRIRYLLLLFFPNSSILRDVPLCQLIFMRGRKSINR